MQNIDDKTSTQVINWLKYMTMYFEHPDRQINGSVPLTSVVTHLNQLKAYYGGMVGSTKKTKERKLTSDDVTEVVKADPESHFEITSEGDRKYIKVKSKLPDLLKEVTVDNVNSLPPVMCRRFNAFMDGIKINGLTTEMNHPYNYIELFTVNGESQRKKHPSRIEFDIVVNVKSALQDGIRFKMTDGIVIAHDNIPAKHLTCYPRCYGSCAGFIIIGRNEDNSNHIATVTHSHRAIGLPKGAIERGETTFQAAIRELNEETGIEWKDLILVPQYPIRVKRRTKDNRYGFNVFIYYYVARYRPTIQRLAPKREHACEITSAQWTNMEHIQTWVPGKYRNSQFVHLKELQQFLVETN